MNIILLVAQIVAGLDEGIASVKVGGLRRLYIPGNLSFPKGLPSGPGRSVALAAHAHAHCKLNSCRKPPGGGSFPLSHAHILPDLILRDSHAPPESVTARARVRPAKHVPGCLLARMPSVCVRSSNCNCRWQLQSKLSALAAGHGCPQRPQLSLMSSCCTFQVSGRHPGVNSC